jgi:AmiR/NasT family two-component response regulator
VKKPENIGVLIVDDDPLVCEMIQGIVDDLGYQVVGRALNGRDGVELTNILKPDVVIMDINMPGISGIEASQQISDLCAAPIVVLTAYENQELISMATTAGVGAYLVKPPNRGELERAIMVAMARFKDLQALTLLNLKLNQQNEALEAALAQVNRLSGLLPICMHCKRIRADTGYWQEVELYIREHSNAEFSHGLCPNCVEEFYSSSSTR